MGIKTPPVLMPFPSAKNWMFALDGPSISLSSAQIFSNCCTQNNLPHSPPHHLCNLTTLPECRLSVHSWPIPKQNPNFPHLKGPGGRERT